MPILLAKKLNLNMQVFTEQQALDHADVIVDAIGGIGLTETLRSEVSAVIHHMQQAKVPIFSLDIPTGIAADTGQVLGTAVRATATLTFIGLKLGLLTGSGLAYAGEVVVNDLQLPPELFAQVDPIAEKISLQTYAAYLQPRPRDWHKGLSGHVLVIGGEVGYSGAACMAAFAAMRVGAGLVSVATRAASTASMNAICPEIMCHAVEQPQALMPLLAKAKVVILGPGLGQSDWAKKLCEVVYAHNLPLIVDADGLNLLAQTPMQRAQWILTPHPGEAARLLEQTPATIQQDRLQAAQAIQKRYGGICILKGAGSVIATETGLPAICTQGNPGMATAGMGDLLSGVLGGLVAQGVPLQDAAKLGVYLHAAAGDLAAKEGERGMMAMDLLPYLRRLSNEVVHTSTHHFAGKYEAANK